MSPMILISVLERSRGIRGVITGREGMPSVYKREDKAGQWRQGSIQLSGGREPSSCVGGRGEPTASSGASMLWPKAGSEKGGRR